MKQTDRAVPYCPKCSNRLSLVHTKFKDCPLEFANEYHIECRDSLFPCDYVEPGLVSPDLLEVVAYRVVAGDPRVNTRYINHLKTEQAKTITGHEAAMAAWHATFGDPLFLIVDLFCGAGGTTTGFALAMLNGRPIAEIIACVNHDPIAIKSHWENHPKVKHFNEDIRTLDLTELVELVELYRLIYPNAFLILWASLECTNFSKAKGGQPRDADSRTLADHLPRYIKALNPDYIQIENVVEFRSWGPLDERGKPVSSKNGEDWIRWRKDICALGYYDEWKELNSADFGAYTSRNRLFGCFAKHGLPILWPEPTHIKRRKAESGKAKGKSKRPMGLQIDASKLKPWKPVKDVLDFADEGNSIFGRKKPLSPKTLARIYAGLVKYVAGGKEAFMLKYNSTDQKGKHTPPSVDKPCPAVATQNRLGMCFITKPFSGRPEGKVTSVEDPAGTITCGYTQSLVKCDYILKYYGGSPEGKTSSVEDPAAVIRCGDGQALVQCFLSHYYGTGGQHSGICEPCPVIPTKARTAKIWLDMTYGGERNHRSVNAPAGVVMGNDKHNLVQCSSWIDRNFNNGGMHSSIEEPAGSILNVPKLNLVQTDPFIMQTSHDRDCAPIDQPCPTLLASRRHHYIINPSHGGHCTSTDAPCPVIVARQDKAPLYVAQAISGIIETDIAEFLSERDMQLFFDMYFEPVYGPQLPVSVHFQIVEFMLMYQIRDIKMRMLKVPELLKIQGFPDDYILKGNQSDQKKFIGNSVVPQVVKNWCEAMAGANFKPAPMTYEAYVSNVFRMVADSYGITDEQLKSVPETDFDIDELPNGEDHYLFD